MPPYIFQIEDLRKTVDQGREVLKHIHLAFFHGAKIGVIGSNGSGKSTLLRIMAGLDTDFDGTARAASGTRIGHLAQEPQLDATKDVRGNVEDGVVETRALLDRFEEISARFGEDLSPDEMEKLLERQGDVQAQIDKDRDHAKQREIGDGPAMFVNQEPVENSDAALRRAIEEALRAGSV